MSIEKDFQGGVLTVKLSGRLDTITAPRLEEDLRGDLASAEKMILDFADVDYISSAGLRLVFLLYKEMQARQGLEIRSVKPIVREVFDMTGLAGLITIC